MLKHTILVSAVLACGASATAGPKEARDYSARLQGVTCVVMVHGKIVHEQYRQPGDETERWRLVSGTKSFSGVAAAAAAQDRLLTLDERVSETLTEWRSDGRKDITIRQLLSLTSGIDTPAPGRGGRRSPDDAVAHRLVHPPGTRYAYGQAPFQIFAALMARKLESESYEAYLERRVLNGLGVTLQFKSLDRLGRGGADWGGGGAIPDLDGRGCRQAAHGDPARAQHGRGAPDQSSAARQTLGVQRH